MKNESGTGEIHLFVAISALLLFVGPFIYKIRLDQFNQARGLIILLLLVAIAICVLIQLDMSYRKRIAKRKQRRESGQSALEYILATAFVACAASTIMPEIAQKIKVIFEHTQTMMAGERVAIVTQTAYGPSTELIRIICAIMAVVFLGLMILFRREHP